LKVSPQCFECQSVQHIYTRNPLELYINVSNSIKIFGNTYYLMITKNQYFTAYFWWGIAKILYFMGLNFENLYGRNTIGFTALHPH
jgi:hypothetical protein